MFSEDSEEIDSNHPPHSGYSEFYFSQRGLPTIFLHRRHSGERQEFVPEVPPMQVPQASSSKLNFKCKLLKLVSIAHELQIMVIESPIMKINCSSVATHVY